MVRNQHTTMQTNKSNLSHLSYSYNLEPIIDTKSASQQQLRSLLLMLCRAELVLFLRDPINRCLEAEGEIGMQILHYHGHETWKWILRISPHKHIFHRLYHINVFIALSVYIKCINVECYRFNVRWY